jgi:glutamate carboxypeptidase
LLVLFTADEEIGSPHGRSVVEESALGAEFVLVLEPPLADGGLKTARKGVGRFRLEVQGRSAHAGIEPEKGVSALVELAHQILRIEKFADMAAGTTLNVGLAAGGTASNVVPGEAVAEIDARAATRAEAERVESALRSLEPVLAGSRDRWEFGWARDRRAVGVTGTSRRRWGCRRWMAWAFPGRELMRNMSI